jgi:hypothetical protein
MLTRDARELRRYPWTLSDDDVLRPRDHHPTATDPEVERLVEIVTTFEKNVPTADSEIRHAVLDIGRYVVGLEEQESHLPIVALTHEATIVRE